MELRQTHFTVKCLLCWSLVICQVFTEVSGKKYNVKFVVKVLTTLPVNSRWSGHRCFSRTSKSTNRSSSFTPTWKRRFKTVTQQTRRWRISHSKARSYIIDWFANILATQPVCNLHIQCKHIIPNKKAITAVLFFFMVNIFIHPHFRVKE